MIAPERRRSLLRRIVPVLLALGVAAILQKSFGALPVELLVSIPAGMDDGSGIDLRITRPNETKLILQVIENRRAASGHTVVVRTKLPKGKYHAQVWLQNAANTPFVSDFDFEGAEAAEVLLTPR